MAEAVSLALGRHLGRAAAHELVESACAEALQSNATLQEVLQVDSRVTQHLNTQALEQLFDPSQYLGEAIAFTDRVLAAHRQRKV